MRRVLAALGACALLVSTAGVTAARPPIRDSDHARDVGCWEVVTPVGVASFSVVSSDAWGADAWIDVWDGDVLVIARDWEQQPTVAFGADGSVSATIPVTPSGTAIVSGTVTPGEPFEYDDQGRFGNSTYRYHVSGTSLAFSGTLSLPGVAEPIPLGPPNCSGSDASFTYFESQPNGRVSMGTSSGGVCELANTDGDTAIVFFGGEEGQLFMDGSVTDAGGTETGFSGGAPVGPDGTAILELFEYDPQTGLETGTGSATVILTATGETYGYKLRFSNGFASDSGTLVDVEGTLDSSAGSFDLGPCIVAMGQYKVVSTSPQGPKPGGKRPPNDLPGGAIALAPGSRATVATKGAQPPREADYPCLQFIDGDGTSFEIPVEHTVWYTISGTGNPVTVDTAGSDFDTVIGVYAGAPDASATVACLDDTPVDPVGRTLQAAVTFDTAAGTTYWVQIGGFNGDIFFEQPDVPYGTLKVAVR